MTEDMRAEALRLVTIAAALANEDAFVLARCGHGFAYFGRDDERGMSMVEQAVALNPNLATVWNSRGWVSLILGEPERSIESFQTVLRLEPLDPLRVTAWEGYRMGALARRAARRGAVRGP